MFCISIASVVLAASSYGFGLLETVAPLQLGYGNHNRSGNRCQRASTFDEIGPRDEPSSSPVGFAVVFVGGYDDRTRFAPN
jgi:hypothetical protein